MQSCPTSGGLQYVQGLHASNAALLCAQHGTGLWLPYILSLMPKDGICSWTSVIYLQLHSSWPLLHDAEHAVVKVLGEHHIPHQEVLCFEACNDGICQ